MKKPIYKRKWFVILAIIFVMGAIGNIGEDNKEGVKQTSNNETNLNKDKVNGSNVKNDLNVTGNLKIEFKDNKAIATITTNAVDGAIFETSIIDGNLNMVSDFVTIKDGKAIKEFEVNKDWEPGYLSAISGMRFNLEDHPQPEEVKKVYGEKGEKLKGELAQANNVDGFNINLENRTVAYPDEATAKAKQDESFNAAMEELINSSNGIIIGVQPRFEAGDWTAVAITISDAWYNSQEHEKERFAEQVADTVKALIINSGKVEEGKTIMVYLFDSYQKELASPKVMGGYKIKR